MTAHARIKRQSDHEQDGAHDALQTAEETGEEAARDL